MEYSYRARLLVSLIREFELDSEVMAIISNPTHKKRAFLARESYRNSQRANAPTEILDNRVPVDSIIERNKQTT